MIIFVFLRRVILVELRRILRAFSVVEHVSKFVSSRSTRMSSSLIYSRQLLKRALSELCHSIGFDRTSEVSMDILVEICERRFAQLFEQIRDDLSVEDYFRLFSSLFDHQREQREQFHQYLQQFPSSTSMERTNPSSSSSSSIYPLKKPNQIFLRIPNEHSQEINERESNPQTEYLFHWLPLFPHRSSLFSSLLFSPFTFFDALEEKSLDSSSRMIQSSHSIDADEEKIVPKSVSLLSLLTPSSFFASEIVPIIR